MKCAVCGNTKEFEKLYPKFCEEKNYLCLKCGLVFISDKGSLKSYYKGDGYYKKSPNKGLRKRLISKSLLIALGKKRLDEIQKKIGIDFTNKKVLDVGCGYGHLIYNIKKIYRADVYGLEPSKQVAEIGNKYFDVNIYADILEDYVSDDKFDIMLCTHTLEHVDNLYGFIDDIKNLLKDDGYLYIEVPNILKPTGNFKLKDFLYKEHFYNFNAHTLERLLNEKGLEIVKYNDSTFLMSLCKKAKLPKTVTKIVTPYGLLEFLENYNNNYNVLDQIYVYKKKFLYLLNALRYKLF